MDVDLLSSQHVAAQLAPVTKREDGDVIVGLNSSVSHCYVQKVQITYIDAFLPQTGEDRVRAATNRPVLAFEDNPNLGTN